jgi:antitoxin component YwqK of YwqJK toxin-antitoxin module
MTILCVVTVLSAAGCEPGRVDETYLEEREGILYRIGSEEPFTGIVTEAFPDTVRDVGETVVARESSYVEGRLEGARVSWHPNGQMHRREILVQGSAQGLVEEWTEQGILVLAQETVDGRPHGPRRTWHADGTPESEATFTSGALDGVLTHWFSSGQMRMQRKYREGKQHGVSREWFEDGQLMIEGSYSDGRIHGPYRRWHPDGTVAVDAEYHRGQTIRIQVWSETGEPIPVEPDIALYQDSVR